MFAELSNILDISSRKTADGQSFLVTESQADSSFVVHHFASLYLRSGFNVCLVGLSQAYNHYRNVGTKLGVDFNKCKEAGKLVFIEGLKLIGESLVNNEKRRNPEDPNDPLPLDLFKDDQNSSLKPLLDMIKRTLDGFPNRDQTPTLVLFDDISILWILGKTPKEILSCLQYVRNLVCGDEHSAGCLVTRLTLDKEVDDDEAEFISRYLTHQSDCIISTRGLPSGYSKDVHGEVRFSLDI